MSPKRSLADDGLEQPAGTGYERLLQLVGTAQAQETVPFTKVLTRQIAQVDGAVHQGFRCLAICARKGDGVSYLADLAAATVRARHRQLTVLEIQGGALGGLPPILRTLPRGAVAKAARRSGVATTFRPPNPWLTAGLIALCAALALPIALLQSYLQAVPQVHGGLGALFKPASIAVTIGLGAMLVGGQLLTNWLRLNPEKPLMARLAEDLRDGTDSDAYERFVDELAVAFARKAPYRAVVVDDWTNVDALTTKVMRRYLDLYVKIQMPELWVMLDAADDPAKSTIKLDVTTARLRRGVPNGHTPLSGRRTQLYDLLPLDVPASLALVAEHGLPPERAQFTTIKGMLSDDSLSVSAMLGEIVPLGSERTDVRLFAAFELFHLLAADSAISGNVTWSDRYLATTLGRGDLVRSAVLRLVLSQTPLTRRDITSRLVRLRKDFGPLLKLEDTDNSLSLSVDPRAGRTLRSEWRDRAVADPELLHLYWGLYWFDLRGQERTDAFWTDKTARHLSRLGGPTEYAQQFRGDAEQIQAAVFEALVATARTALGLTMVNYVPELVRLAELYRPPGPAPLRRLRRLCRDSYAVLGDTRILGILLDLLGEEQPSAATLEADAQDEFVALFAESIVTRRLGGLVDVLGRRDPAVAGLRRFACANGIWIALSLDPLVKPGAARSLSPAGTQPASCGWRTASPTTSAPQSPPRSGTTPTSLRCHCCSGAGPGPVTSSGGATM
ncbi:hypothetical protein [Dactylosporangium sp. NPDC048998]|uniref:hypothetical protein n=1 Tax=Dactylosporangium sp. NPDC048998 TaxID=3363976 RepID=UPI0037241554